jgi:hypothetical protein
MAEEGMTALQSWLGKPRATVRIDAGIPWVAWIKMLRWPFGAGKQDMRPRIEVLDRLSLGGKKSLLLVCIERRQLLVGVGDEGAPSILNIEGRQIYWSNTALRRRRIALRGRGKARR